MIDESNSMYEAMLDKTTRSLESIIKNTESNLIFNNARKIALRKKAFQQRKKDILKFLLHFLIPFFL